MGRGGQAVCASVVGHPWHLLKGAPAGGDLLFLASLLRIALVTPWDGTFWLSALSATSQVAGICVLGE